MCNENVGRNLNLCSMNFDKKSVDCFLSLSYVLNLLNEAVNYEGQIW